MSFKMLKTDLISESGQAIVINPRTGPYTYCANIKDTAKGFIFLGTPHRGSSITMIGRLFSMLGYWQGASTTLLDSMEIGSTSNEELHTAFLQKISSGCTAENILCIFEAVKEQIFGFPIMQVSHQLRIHQRSMQD